MVERLRAALGASDSFDFPDPVEVKNLEYIHFVNRKGDSHSLQSLSSRLVKSQSPFLVVLQNLYNEEKVAATINEYLGAWAPSLGVVIAERPGKVFFDEGKQREFRDKSDVIESQVLDESAERACRNDTVLELLEEDHQDVSRNMKTGLNEESVSAVTGGLSNFSRNQKLASINMLGAHVRNTENGDPFFEKRVTLNCHRTYYLEDLLVLREDQANFDLRVEACHMLKSFLHNPQDDPNRLLIDYWLSRLNLAKHSFPESDNFHGSSTYIDDHDNVHLDESAASHLFGRLQQYTRDRRTLVGEFRSKALNAREASKRDTKAAESYQEELKFKAIRDFSAARARAREEAVKRFSKINDLPGNDGAPPSRFMQLSHSSLHLPFTQKVSFIDTRSKIAEDKLHSMAADLAHRRRDLASHVNRLVAREEAEFTNSSRVTSQFIEDQASYKKHKQNVEAIRDIYKSGSNAFYSQLTEKMASGAQSSLEAIDRKFTDSDIYSTDHGGTLDELLWEVEEKRWRVETTENSRRRMCKNLSEDLERRIEGQNKALFQVELERVERLQKLKDLKLERQSSN